MHSLSKTFVLAALLLTISAAELLASESKCETKLVPVVSNEFFLRALEASEKREDVLPDIDKALDEAIVELQQEGLITNALEVAALNKAQKLRPIFASGLIYRAIAEELIQLRFEKKNELIGFVKRFKLLPVHEKQLVIESIVENLIFTIDDRITIATSNEFAARARNVNMKEDEYARFIVQWRSIADSNYLEAKLVLLNELNRATSPFLNGLSKAWGQWRGFNFFANRPKPRARFYLSNDIVSLSRQAASSTVAAGALDHVLRTYIKIPTTENHLSYFDTQLDTILGENRGTLRPETINHLRSLKQKAHALQNQFAVLHKLKQKKTEAETHVSQIKKESQRTQNEFAIRIAELKRRIEHHKANLRHAKLTRDLSAKHTRDIEKMLSRQVAQRFDGSMEPSDYAFVMDQESISTIQFRISFFEKNLAEITDEDFVELAERYCAIYMARVHNYSNTGTNNDAVSSRQNRLLPTLVDGLLDLMRKYRPTKDRSDMFIANLKTRMANGDVIDAKLRSQLFEAIEKHETNIELTEAASVETLDATEAELARVQSVMKTRLEEFRSKNESAIVDLQKQITELELQINAASQN